GVLIENNYIHDWVSNTDVSTLTAASNFYYSLGAIEDGHNRVDVDHDIIGDASGFVFAGATKKNGGFGGGCVNCKTVTNNTIHDGFAACFSTLVACAGNEIFGIHQPNIADCFGDSTCKGAGAARPHTQVVEDDFGAFSQVQVYNNYIHDNTMAGVTIYMNYSAQIYNNVMSNNANGNILIGRPGSGYTSLTGTGYVLNNTVDASNGTVCFATDGKATQPGPLVRNNNLCITNGNETSIVSTITSFTNGPNNYKMPTSEASSFGFVSSGKYKPSSSDSNVTAKGANLTSSCTGGLAVLCQDASGAPWFGGSPVTRPTGSTAWDLGAFMGQGGTTGPPTVTITSPSAGTVSGTQTLTATCTPQGTATCTSVQFTIDGFPFGAPDTSPPYTISWDTTTAANANHVIGATATDSNSNTGTAGTVAVTVSNSSPGCFVSSDNDSGTLSWTANQAFTAQTANFSATVTAKPNTANQDSVVALSQAAMGAFGDGAALLRFNSSGFIDVYKGSIGNYAADNSAPYTAGTSYTFTIAVNFTGPNAGTYSVTENSPSSIAIATNY